jgi:hypothetical protein
MTVRRSFAITLLADAQPDVLLRVATQLNFLNEPPRRFTMVLGSDETVAIEIVTSELGEGPVDLVVRKLWQLTCTREVTLQRP